MYKIKQLEWQQDWGRQYDSYHAKVFDKKYTVWEMDGIWRVKLSQDREVVFSNIANSFDLAKEHAEKDFEWRVRQYLVEVNHD
jgi:hypothetical protein